MEYGEVMEQKAVAQKDLSSNDILRSKGLLNDEQNLLKTTTLDEIKEWKEKVVEEQKKWDALDAVQQTDTGPKLLTKDVSFEKALEDVKKHNFEKVPPHVVVSKSRISKFWSWIFGPKPLAKSLLAEQKLVFNFTSVTIDNDNDMHDDVLQTIYRKLTKTKHNHPRFGPHWEEIGFQGSDPATDLRGTGFLSLLQLLFLVSNHLPIAEVMYKLSVDPIHNFPFCLVSINATKIALQALREEKLSNACNKRNEVIPVFNDFYLATFWHFYSIWKREHKTMIDSGNVIKTLESYAMKNVHTLIKTVPDIIEKCETIQKQQAQDVAPVTFSRLSIASTESESTLNQSHDAVIQPKIQHIQQISTDTFEGVIDLSCTNFSE